MQWDHVLCGGAECMKHHKPLTVASFHPWPPHLIGFPNWFNRQGPFACFTSLHHGIVGGAIQLMKEMVEQLTKMGSKVIEANPGYKWCRNTDMLVCIIYIYIVDSDLVVLNEHVMPLQCLEFRKDQRKALTSDFIEHRNHLQTSGANLSNRSFTTPEPWWCQQGGKVSHKKRSLGAPGVLWSWPLALVQPQENQDAKPMLRFSRHVSTCLHNMYPPGN